MTKKLQTLAVQIANEDYVILEEISRQTGNTIEDIMGSAICYYISRHPQSQTEGDALDEEPAS